MQPPGGSKSQLLQLYSDNIMAAEY